jgi:hypothetical protein
MAVGTVTIAVEAHHLPNFVPHEAVHRMAFDPTGTPGSSR